MENEKLDILLYELKNLVADIATITIEYEENNEHWELGKQEYQSDHLKELVNLQNKIQNIERNLYFDTYGSRFLNE